jgi:two-component system OmpR family response regulator
MLPAMNELEVLVVDGARSCRQLLARALSADLGVGVSVAADGTEALDRCRIAAPDVILLDLELPDVDGVEVVRRLRSEPSTALVPVLLLTAAGDGRVEAALAEGADEAIAKPFDLDDLCSRLALWLCRSASRSRGRSRPPAVALAPV